VLFTVAELLVFVCILMILCNVERKWIGGPGSGLILAAGTCYICIDFLAGNDSLQQVYTLGALRNLLCKCSTYVLT